MAISHLCTTCGLDLARVRAAVDPHYGLPLVCCPRCRHYQFRRKYPILRRWKQARRILNSFFHLTLRAIIIIELTFVGQNLNRTFVRDFSRAVTSLRNLIAGTGDRLPNSYLLDDLTFVFSWISLSLLGGAFVAGALHHWKRPLAWGAWLTFLILLMFIPYFQDLWRSLTLRLRSPESIGFFRVPPWQRLREEAVGPFAMFALSFVGARIGWMFVRAAEKRRKQKFAKRRAKRRKQQNA